ncbi:uncharacterized protein [Malus domestica]|uniref:uncharacterized protein n=1 Tax=Malus domestica TaxID=3750 RepID=UPI0039747B5C
MRLAGRHSHRGVRFEGEKGGWFRKLYLGLFQIFCALGLGLQTLFISCSFRFEIVILVGKNSRVCDVCEVVIEAFCCWFPFDSKCANWRYSDGQQLPPLSMNLAVRKNLTVENVKALLEVEYFDLG